MPPAVVLTENSSPFFVVPTYTRSNQSYESILSDWTSSLGYLQTLDYPTNFSDSARFFSTPEVSSSRGKFFALYPRHNAIGIWNSPKTNVPNISLTNNINFEGVDGIVGLPWDTTNLPSVILCFSPLNETGYVRNFSMKISSTAQIISWEFDSNTNPTVAQKVALLIENSGRMRILLKTVSPAQARYFQVNPETGGVVGAGVINNVTNNSVGVIDNGHPISGSSFFYDDGEGPDFVLCRSWDLHRRSISQATPGVEGHWEFRVPTPEYDLTFIRNGCQPITHGPFRVYS